MMPNHVSSSRSLVNIADFPDSPSDWPADDPILVECWGGTRERAAARLLAGFRFKLDGFSAGSWDVAEIADDRIASDACVGTHERGARPVCVHHALGTKYRTPIRLEGRRFDDRVTQRHPSLRGIDTVFPAADRPGTDSRLEQQARLEAALDIFNAMPVEDTESRIAASTAVRQAREARDAALEAYHRDSELGFFRDALRVAVRRDALNACGR